MPAIQGLRAFSCLHAPLRSYRAYFDCAALTFAHRARCAAAIFFRAAAERVRLGREPLVLFAPDCPRTFAHRAFCAAAILRRAAADKLRRETVANFPPSNLPSTARAASTWRRLFTRCARSALNSVTMFPNPSSLGIDELYRISRPRGGYCHRN